MEIVGSPEENAVKRLLAESGLPTADIAVGHMEHFFGCSGPSGLAAVVGLELYSNVGLLRSLAVAAPARGCGLGKRLVAHAERYAQERGVKELYLLTTTAEAFFSRLGYRQVARDAVPDAIKASREYAGICPASSAVMTRKLTG
jgi:amino-acid N-acetyltransferase